jgi:hypothetical protein
MLNVFVGGREHAGQGPATPNEPEPPGWRISGGRLFCNLSAGWKSTDCNKWNILPARGIIWRKIFHISTQLIINRGYCMFRLCLGFSGVVFVVMLCCVPASAIAEEASTVQENPNNFIWSVSAQTGYQYMDLSFKAPFDTGSFGMELFHPSPLELELHNANLWVIGLGADVKKGRFSGFLEAKRTCQKIRKSPVRPNLSGPEIPRWSGTIVN